MISRKIILTLLLIISMPLDKALSDPGPIWGRSNAPIGYFSGDGSITGSNGELAGTLRNNIILDPSNMPIGSIDPDGTTSTNDGSFVIKSPDPRVGAILLLHVLDLK